MPIITCIAVEMMLFAGNVVACKIGSTASIPPAPRTAGIIVSNLWFIIVARKGLYVPVYRNEQKYRTFLNLPSISYHRPLT